MKKIAWVIFLFSLKFYWPLQKIHNHLLLVTKGSDTCKIFCIGNVKTGTRSLYKALKILGYNIPMFFDWPTFLKYGDEKYIEHLKKSGYDAFVDFPMGHKDLYKKIEASFPEGKFILTLRDNASFKKSYSNYFKIFPEIQNELSERITDLEKRNEEIIRYFQDRNSRLLIMNIIEGDGWERLCEFLHRPIPKNDFPHKNKSKYIE